MIILNQINFVNAKIAFIICFNAAYAAVVTVISETLQPTPIYSNGGTFSAWLIHNVQCNLLSHLGIKRIENINNRYFYHLIYHLFDKGMFQYIGKCKVSAA